MKFSSVQRTLLCVLTFAVAVALVPSVAKAGTHVSTTPVTIPGSGSSGPANPYPTTIAVAGEPGVISNVNVRLNGLTHTYAEDLEIMLVGPGGQNIVLMSDSGGGFSLTDTNLTFSDDFLFFNFPQLPDDSSISSGTYNPTNNGAQGDFFAPPAPAPSGNAFMNVFNGTDPNGVWQLYIYDQYSFDVGDLDGWELRITTANSRSNATSITVPASGTAGAATPYPSNINVSGFPTQLEEVTVTLRNFSHTFPSDVDVLLQGPGGQNALIMSDAGGGTDVNNVTFTLDDDAPSPLPSFGGLSSGTYRPTNYSGNSDSFPPPAPTPSGSALSVFDGTNPNGTWSLWVVDNAGGDVGSFAGGWSITITPRIPHISINDVAVSEGDAGTTNANFTVSLDQTPTSTLTVNAQTADGTASSTSDYSAVGPTTLTFAPGDTSETFSVPINGDTAQEGDETFFVNLSGASGGTIDDPQGIGTILNDDVVCLRTGSTLDIVIGTDESFTIQRSGSNFNVIGPGISDASCGGSTVNNVDQVNVTASSGNESLLLDLSGGPFAPGASGEGTGLPEIEFNVDMSTGTGDSLVIQGQGTADNIRVGAGGVNWNGDDDADVSLAGQDEFEIKGDSGADTLSAAGGLGTGSAYPDRIKLTGGPGNDNLTGGDGPDVLNGAQGNDVERGGDGPDTFSQGTGPNGADQLFGDADADTLDYQDRSGNLVVTLNNVANDGEAGEGDNAMSTVEGVRGGSGADQITGSSSVNKLSGRGGNDKLNGGGNADVMSGGNGNDQLTGAGGADFMDGGDGDDQFLEGAGPSGSDVMIGGDGTSDRVSYTQRTVGLVVSLDNNANDGASGEGDNVRSDVEDVFGGSAIDVITGSAVANNLRGNGGADTLAGGAGGDTLTGGAGDDTMKGEAGNDTLFARDNNADTEVDGGGGTGDRCQVDAADNEQNCEIILP
jgi:subtilisin-like proprotein convertase family protein